MDFELELSTQSSYFIPFYTHSSTVLAELDFFFLCHDHRLTPASHRVTTERLMIEYFIVEGCPKPISIPNELRNQVIQ